MADDTSFNITINADGTMAVQALDSVGEATKRIVAVHEDMKTRFAESFEHVGVHLFGRELLGFIGLGNEARVMLSTLQLGVTAVGSAFGFMTGPVGLVVMGLGALAAIWMKVHEAHEKHKESLDQSIASIQQGIAQIDSMTGALDKYKDIVGKLPGPLQDVYDAEKDLLAIRQEQNKLDLTQKAKDLEAEMQKMVSTLDPLSGITLQAAKRFRELNDELKKTRADLDSVNKGFSSAEDRIKKTSSAVGAYKKHLEEMRRASEKVGEESIKMMEDVAKSVNEAAARAKKATDKEFGDMADIGLKSFKSLGDGFGQTVGQMIVMGESWGKAWDKMIERVEEQFVSAIAAMMVKLAALIAMEAVADALGGPGAAASVASAFHGTNFFTKALGGQGMVTQPTLFMAGEAGPEYYNFTPAGGGSSTTNVSSQGGDTISVVNHFHGITDPDQIADTIGDKIARRIRGRGDISMSRPY